MTGGGASRFASIVVTDSGVGMRPDVLAWVFALRFTSKAEHKGTGPGLAMAYGTVKDHRGAITIDSAVGQGTTVTMH